MFSQVEMEKNKLNLPNMRRLEKTFLQRFSVATTIRTLSFPFYSKKVYIFPIQKIYLYMHTRT